MRVGWGRTTDTDTRTHGHADMSATDSGHGQRTVNVRADIERTRFVYEAPDMPDRSRRDHGADIDRALLVISGMVTFGVGNWSITTLMRDAGAPWIASIGAAGVFDLIALAASVRVYRLRHTPHKALGPMLVMMTSVLTSMGVNGYHGWVMGGWSVMAVLGAVPLAFESVWLMQHGMKPWAVLWNFKRERRAMIRRDAHAALYGMTSRADMSAADTRTLDVRADIVTDTDTRTADIVADTDTRTVKRTPRMRTLSARTDTRTADIVADSVVSTDTDTDTDTVDMPAADSVRVSVSTDTRVREVADMLARGETVTGKALAARYGVVDRTGRRILDKARELNGATS